MTFPFRADQVGSFLRPEVLKKARADLKDGKITQKELSAIEDAEIKKLVEKQIAAGLKCVTDGEFRRQSWLYDFHIGFLGVEGFTPPTGIQFVNSTTNILDFPKYTGKIAFNPNHAFFSAFEYLKSITPTGITPKVCIPSPSMVVYDILGAKPPAPYTCAEDFVDDLGLAYQKTIQQLADLGLKYLQIDDCAWSQVIHASENPSGVLGTNPDLKPDPDALGALILRMNQKALLNRPKGLFIAMHNCRGNCKSDYFTSGPYTSVAKFIAQVDVDALFLEFDGARCGGFECLKDIAEGPYGKTQKVVLGLVSSKVNELEKEDDIIKRIKEASAFFPLERLYLSPQCGFASTEAGNLITEETQYAKIRLVESIAKKVWG